MSCCCNSDSENDDNKPKVRECTDVLWLWLFITFWLAIIFVASFAYVYGNPRRLINGYDSFGNICGSDTNEKFGDFDLSGIKTTEKPYLFFMDFEDSQQSLQICVKQCPDEDMTTLMDIENFFKRTGSLLCRYDMDFNVTENTGFPINSPIGPCPKLPVYKSTPIFNRCVPEVAKDTGISILNQNWNLIENLFGKLYASWLRILFITVLSFVLSSVVVLLMYTLASSISWIIMILVSLVSVVLTVVLWCTYFEIKCKLDAIPPEQLLEEEVNNEEAYKLYSVVSSVFTLGVLLLVFLLRKRTSVLVTVFQETSNCLSEIPFLCFQPIISFFLMLAFYIFWISVVICLASAGFPESKNLKLFSVISPASPQYGSLNSEAVDLVPLNISVNELKGFTVVYYKESSWLKCMLLVYVIGLIWISQFILACQQMIVAGTVAKWYFTKSHTNSKSIVLTSMGNTICYHVGSVVLGSILIPLLKIPRIIMLCLLKTFRMNKNNLPSVKRTQKYCFCNFCCFDKFIRYINHNAYAVVIVQGINFYPAAMRAWNITSDSPLRLSIVNNAGDLILFLAKCFVSCATTCITILILKFDSALNLFAGLTLIICVFVYFISDSVISLYEIVTDTIFLCICEDQKLHFNKRQWKTTLLANIEYSGIKCRSEPAPTEL